jgi:hypothetical protein
MRFDFDYPEVTSLYLSRLCSDGVERAGLFSAASTECAALMWTAEEIKAFEIMLMIRRGHCIPVVLTIAEE